MSRYIQTCLVFYVVVTACVPCAYGGYTFEQDIPYTVEVSSVLSSSNDAYVERNMTLTTPIKAWCEGEKGSGDGSWVQAQLVPQKQEVVNSIIVRLHPGYGKSNKLFFANARPKVIRFEVIDDSGANIVTSESRQWLVEDRPKLQEFVVQFSKAMRMDNVKINMFIDNVYLGAKYKDMCITELAFYVNSDDSSSDFDYVAWEKQSKIESDYLSVNLPQALKGEVDSMQGILRLASGSYFKSSEGGEYISGIYMDLLIAYPDKLINLLSKQVDDVKVRVVDSVLSPINDKYSHEEIKEALEKANVTMGDLMVSKLFQKYNVGN